VSRSVISIEQYINFAINNNNNNNNDIIHRTSIDYEDYADERGCTKPRAPLFIQPVQIDNAY